MNTLRSLAVVLAAAVLLTGCAAAAPATSTASITPTAVVTTPAATVTSSPSALAAPCTYGEQSEIQIFLVLSSWDLVKATYGTTDHPDMLKSLMKNIKRTQKAESGGTDCAGHLQLIALAATVATLNLDVVSDPNYQAPYSDYQDVVTLGNLWFDAIGYTEHRFSTGGGDATS